MTKEYTSEIKKLASEADKILKEFRAGLGADFKRTQTDMAQITAEFTELKDVLAEMEAKQQIGRFTGTNGISPEVKGMMEHIAKGCHREDYKMPAQYKAASVGVPSSGGYLAAPEFVDKVVQRLYDSDAILQSAEVISVNSNIAHVPYEAGDAAAHWVGEKESRDTDDSAPLGLAQIPVSGIIAKIKMTHELMYGTPIALEQYLVNQVSNKLQRSLGEALCNGNGFAKPLGVYTNTNIPSVTTTGAGTVKAIAVNDILDMYGKLPDAADSKSAWYMSKSTFASVAKTKGADNLYLMPGGIAAGMPGTILGRPVRFCTSAPDVTTAGNVPVLFGDMENAYKVIQGLQMTYQRDEFTGADSGMIYYRFFGFYGGQTVMPTSLVRMIMGS